MPQERKPLSTAQKLATASALYWSARTLKENALRKLHPDWDEDRIKKEVRAIFMFSPSLNR